ncbi:MAG: S8 family serine peptidase [Candidatus Nanopelagicales bacterium]
MGLWSSGGVCVSAALSAALILVSAVGPASAETASPFEPAVTQSAVAAPLASGEVPAAPSEVLAVPSEVLAVPGEVPAVPGERGGEPSPSALDEVAAGVAGGEKMRLVVVRAGADGPEVTTQRVADTNDARGIVAELDADANLLAVGVDQRVHTVGTTDPMRADQWGLTALDVETAWPLATGRGVTVAVLDSGVDASHPDLAGALVPGTSTRGGDRSAPDTDPNGHGTHVAGVIAARANNGLGVAGVAPEASIMPVKVLGSDGSGWLSDVTEGIVWATDHGATVINLSLGGPDASVMAPAVEYAQRRGVTVVAAAGNDASAEASYPAALPGVVSVAAIGQRLDPAPFSNRGETIDFAAPGSGVLSTVPGGYESMSGTSMAAPHVSGVVALVRSIAPGVDPVAMLQAGATDLGAPGRDDRYGDGAINAARSVASACPTCSAPADPESVPQRDAPATPATKKQSLNNSVKRLRVGRTALLPNRTDQGLPIRSWDNVTPRTCRLLRRDDAFRIRGLHSGRCRLKVTAAAGSGYSPFTSVLSVRVTAA